MAVRTPGDTRPMAQPQRPTGADSYPPQSLGPNGGPGRTVRPTEGRPFALHSNEFIEDVPTSAWAHVTHQDGPQKIRD